jgi:hypothetical protein
VAQQAHDSWRPSWGGVSEQSTTPPQQDDRAVIVRFLRPIVLTQLESRDDDA